MGLQRAGHDWATEQHILILSTIANTCRALRMLHPPFNALHALIPPNFHKSSLKTKNINALKVGLQMRKLWHKELKHEVEPAFELGHSSSWVSALHHFTGLALSISAPKSRRQRPVKGVSVPYCTVTDTFVPPTPHTSFSSHLQNSRD